MAAQTAFEVEAVNQDDETAAQIAGDEALSIAVEAASAMLPERFHARIARTIVAMMESVERQLYSLH